MASKCFFWVAAVAMASMLDTIGQASSDRPQVLLRGSKLLLGVCLALLATTMVVEDVANADDTTYYVDAASGNDSNSGTSTTRAWRTIDRANTLDLQSGDRLLFRAARRSWATSYWAPKMQARRRDLSRSAPTAQDEHALTRARASGSTTLAESTSHDSSSVALDSPPAI
jgi:hypothetical protein